MSKETKAETKPAEQQPEEQRPMTETERRNGFAQAVGEAAAKFNCDMVPRTVVDENGRPVRSYVELVLK